MVVGLAHTRTHVCASSSHQPTETSTTSIDHHRHRRQPATTTTTRPTTSTTTRPTIIMLSTLLRRSISSSLRVRASRPSSSHFLNVVVAASSSRASTHHHKHHRGNLAKPAPSLRVPCPSIAITAHDLPPRSCGLLDNHSDATATATTAVRRLRHQAVVPVVDRRRPQVLLASLQGRREQLPTSANHSCPSSQRPRAIVARGTPDAPEPIRRAPTRAHGAVLRTGAVLERPAAGGGRVLPAAAADWLHHASAKGSKLASKLASKQALVSCELVLSTTRRLLCADQEGSHGWRRVCRALARRHVSRRALRRLAA